MEQIHVILKKELNSITLKDNLRKLFKKTQFSDINYVIVYIRFQLYHLESKSYKSLGHKFVLNLKKPSDISSYINYLMDKYDRHYVSMYESADVVKMICYYKSTNEKEYKTFQRKNKNTRTFFENVDTGIKSYLNLPFNTLYGSWGTVKISNKNEYIINNCIFNSDIECIKISEFIQRNIVYGVIYFKAMDKTNIQFTDKKLNDGNIQRIYNVNGSDSIIYTFNPFTYTPSFFIDKNVLPIDYDKDGNRLNILTEIVPTDKKEEEALKKGKIYSKPKFKVITLDIETYYEEYVVKNKKMKQHKILCICFYDGKNTYKFYRNNYDTDVNMLTQCFNKLLSVRYNNYTIYIHNGSNFDLVFLLEYLLNRDGVTIPAPLYKDNKFLSLDVQYQIEHNDKKDLCKIRIMDSYLLLSNSLSKLGKALQTETQKDIFPYEFPNLNNLDYIGEVPDYSYFDANKVDYNEYLNYKSKFKKWNLKYETLNYCSKDCISLYQIISNFRDLIDDKFSVELLGCPTTASLAYRIFKARYYNSKDTPIPLLTRELYLELDPWFFGGHVDMYIPTGPSENGTYENIISKFKSIVNKTKENILSIFKTINHYDVNSLYPSVMAKYKYPTDILLKFIGDIKESEFNDLYDTHLGFYKVKVKAPDIDHPLLPIRIKGKTIYGYGEWTGIYFSEEIKNAEKYGYQFDILGGYIYNSEYLFKGYVESLYQIKESVSKTDAMYLISKLLLNNLFGRFGLDPWLGQCEFITKSNFEKYLELGHVDRSEIEEVEFTNHVLIKTPSTEKFGIQAYLPIAMAVTAYARIEMSIIKNNPNIRLYYSDTDSAFIYGYLPNEWVHNSALGKWKLEDQYLYCVFLGPKMYACLNIKGESYSKVKGYKKTIPLDVLVNFLDLDYAKDLVQTKWFKYINESKIIVNESSKFKLRVTELKRNLIYDNNKLVGTSNIKIVASNSKNYSNPTPNPNN